MRYYKVFGTLVCVGLIVSCFLPWAYYPDLDKVFTGFFSEQNLYGKPGKVFVFFAVVSLVFIFVDKVWAKRINLLCSALTVAYLIKTVILFTGCYNGVCPEKLYGLYMVIGFCVLLFVISFLPDLKIKDTSIKEKNVPEQMVPGKGNLSGNSLEGQDNSLLK